MCGAHSVGQVRVLHQVVEGVAGHLDVVVGGVVAELVEVGVRLVGDALAVAIDVDAGEGGGLDRVAAEFPDAVERLVGGLEGAASSSQVAENAALRTKCSGFTSPGQPSISTQRNGRTTPHSFGVRMAGGSKPFPCWVFFAFGAGATTCGFPPVHFPATAEYRTVPGGLRLIRPSWNASPKWTLKSPVAPSGAVISMFPNATFPKSSRTMPGGRGGDGNGRLFDQLHGGGMHRSEASEGQDGKYGFHAGEMYFVHLRAAFSFHR